MAQQSGVVKNWNGDRGFGFVAPDTGGDDVFVHVRSLEDGRQALNIGEKVTYSITTDEKSGKTRAATVRGDGTGTPVEASGGRGGGRGGFRGRGGRGGRGGGFRGGRGGGFGRGGRGGFRGGRGGYGGRGGG